jgi:nicotine blue oxidoreductase
MADKKHHPIRPIGIILLAAGAARRFGRDKLQEPFRGRPLIEWSIEAAVASALGPVLVVMRDGQPHPSPSVEPVTNPHPEEGLASSVRCGLQAAEHRDWMAAILAPADQPFLSSSVFLRLADAFDRGASLVVAAYDGLPRNPVLLGRSRWADAMVLQGDTGLAAITRSQEAARTECGDIASIADIDTPADLLAFQNTLVSP